LIHTCTIQKRHRTQKLTFTSGTGTATVGQTLTGATSHSTAVIVAIASGYLVVRTLSAAFTPTEHISTTTWGATLGTQTDFERTSGGVDYYWSNDSTNVRCRFYYATEGGAGTVAREPGEMVEQPLKCALPKDVTIDATEYRLVSTIPGFAGTFGIAGLYPLGGGFGGLDHWEAVLKRPQT
jgi:hypothetical protein